MTMEEMRAYISEYARALASGVLKAKASVTPAELSRMAMDRAEEGIPHEQVTAWLVECFGSEEKLRSCFVEVHGENDFRCWAIKPESISFTLTIGPEKTP